VKDPHSLEEMRVFEDKLPLFENNTLFSTGTRYVYNLKEGNLVLFWEISLSELRGKCGIYSLGGGMLAMR
jgi:hypothetical protein